MTSISLGKSKNQPKKIHPNSGLRHREGLIGLLFIAPWIIGFILLKLVPILAAFVFSFTNFHMMTPEQTQFIGLANYAKFLTDLGAWTNLVGSLGYFLTTVPLELLLALGLAVILSSERLPARGLLRSLIFMPSIISAAAIFFIWLGLVDPYSGWLNQLIMTPLGLPPVSNNSFETFITMITIWSIGPGFLIMYGAIQGIPKEIIEASRIDGAGPMMRLVKITLPMVSPAIFFSLVINLTSAFGGALLLDRGYIFSGSLSPMEGYIGYVMYTQQDLGYATTLAWVMFAATMTITIFLFRSARHWVYFPEETGNDSL